MADFSLDNHMMCLLDALSPGALGGVRPRSPGHTELLRADAAPSGESLTIAQWFGETPNLGRGLAHHGFAGPCKRCRANKQGRRQTRDASAATSATTAQLAL